MPKMIVTGQNHISFYKKNHKKLLSNIKLYLRMWILNSERKMNPIFTICQLCEKWANQLTSFFVSL